MKKIILISICSSAVLFGLFIIIISIILLTTNIDEVNNTENTHNDRFTIAPTKTPEFFKLNQNIKIEDKCYLNVNASEMSYKNELSKYDLKEDQKIIQIKIKFINDNTDDMLYSGSFYATNNTDTKLDMYYSGDDSSIFEAVPPSSTLDGNIYFKYRINTKYINLLYDHGSGDMKKFRIMIK